MMENELRSLVIEGEVSSQNLKVSLAIPDADRLLINSWRFRILAIGESSIIKNANIKIAVNLRHRCCAKH